MPVWPADRRCANCMFTVDTGTQLECHIEPPVPQPPQANKPAPAALFPIVDPTGWCSRWYQK